MEHNRNLKGIQRKIEMLGQNEHGVLLKMVTDAGVKCVHNQNGFFFNLVGIDNELLGRISEFVDFSINNNKELESYDRDMHNKVQLLQRVPALSAPQHTPSAKKPPRVPVEYKRQAPEVQKEPQTPRTAKLAFVRRATDTTKKSRVAREEGLEFEVPDLLVAQ